MYGHGHGDDALHGNGYAMYGLHESHDGHDANDGDDESDDGSSVRRDASDNARRNALPRRFPVRAMPGNA